MRSLTSTKQKEVMGSDKQDLSKKVDAISLDKRDKDEEQAMGLLSEGSKAHATSPGGSVFGHLSIEQRQQLNEANNNAKQALTTIMTSWASKKFMSGCAILFPITFTIYVTMWFLAFFDQFFSPVYHLFFGFHVFGLGFITSMAFIFLTGVFVSSWLGGFLLWLGEWFIKHVPLVKHIYSASKQISQALNPAVDNAPAFRECVLIRHPRHGEYAFAFVTGECIFQKPDGDEKLFSVFVPTNHIYVGDIFLLSSDDIFRTTLSVREGIEIVVSGGMALPPILATLGTYKGGSMEPK
mmetsp:Transcript_2095/g.3572  ORF Transcript_2095/g.3572 Transcript_2095/m.3572 type:complete len:295 (+) Transcript_2095:381-1265(+)